MRKLGALFLVAAVMVYAVKKVYHPPRPMAARSTSALLAVPPLSLTDLNGNALNTASYKGKVLLVNFWAAWCTPCAEEVPQFMALQKKYESQGLQVIGFSVDDNARELQDFYRKYGMNYPVAPSDAQITAAFGGVFGLPTTFVIGRDGTVRARHDGSANFPAMEQEVVALLRTAK